MPKEIERRFLIREDGVIYANNNLSQIAFAPHNIRCSVEKNVEYLVERIDNEGDMIVQGYISDLGMASKMAENLGLEFDFDPREARLRKKISRKNGKTRYTFGLKGLGDIERPEIEKVVSKSYFLENWILTEGHVVHKKRLVIPLHQDKVECNYFTDRKDLIMAEVEFRSLGLSEFFPAMGKEVTDNYAYNSVNLAK